VNRIAKSLVIFGLLVVLAASGASAKGGRKIRVDDDPSLKNGSPTAVLIEVSDFQCPWCGKGAREVLPRIHEKYVKNGKVELVYVDLPLQMHSQAFNAAQAAACAGDQAKFWEMHDVLFANQKALGDAQLRGYAEKVGVDLAVFDKCVAGRKHDGAIREDMRLAQSLGIFGTPAYLLGRRVAGSDQVEIVQVMDGLPPYEELERGLDALIALP